VSDISLGNLTGVYALVGTWALAALFGLVAIVLTVVTGVTEKRTTWGRSALSAWALAIGILVSGYASLRLPEKIRDVLDETMHFWAVGVAALGGYLCCRAGREIPRRTSDESREESK
jgi:protein-S-isoprenylcysteine O-methyltransferase Ste14